MSALMYMFCTLVWGLNFIVVKIQGDFVSQEVSLAYRLLLATILFAFLAYAKGLKASAFLKLARKNLIALVIFGVCSLSINYLLLYYATFWCNAALVTLIFSLKVVMTPVMISIFLREKIKPKFIVGGIIGLLGVVLVVWPSLWDKSSADITQGVLLAVAGTLITSVGDISASYNLRNRISTTHSNLIGFFVSSIIVLFICFVKDRSFTVPIYFSYISSVLYLAIASSFLAWTFFLKLIRKIGIIKSANMVALFPVIGSIASIFIGELKFSLGLLLGCVLCSLGVFVAQMGLVESINMLLRIYPKSIKVIKSLKGGKNDLNI